MSERRNREPWGSGNRSRPDGSMHMDAGDAGTAASSALAWTSVTQAFFQRAASQPDGVAAIHDGQRVTYAELASEAMAIARRLSVSCPPGATVAVPALPTPRVVAAFLGITAARCTYLPIDPRLPAPRQAMMLGLAGCSTTLEGPDGTPPAACEVRVWDPPPRGASEGSAPSPDDVAYVLFTSGSTGVPKAVEVSHRAIAASVRALREVLEVTAADRVLQFASLSWDTCFEEILPAVTSGATLVFDDDARCGSLPRLLRMLERERITVLDLPTPFWHELVDYLNMVNAALPRSLRVVVIGGDRVDGALLARWRKLDAQHIRLVNTYGCTETCLVTHAVDLSGPRATRPVLDLEDAPIGQPLTHVRQQLRAHGVDGADDGVYELYVGGPSVANGYRGQPDETVRRFVLFEDEPRAGSYFRTGDLVRSVAGGMLAIHGRADRQLKVRGIRVDLAEIELALRRLPEVAEAAVVAIASAGRTALKAYVVGQAGVERQGLAGRIRTAMRAEVPEYLIPQKILAIDALPRTSSGKVHYFELANLHAVGE